MNFGFSFKFCRVKSLKPQESLKCCSNYRWENAWKSCQVRKMKNVHKALLQTEYSYHLFYISKCCKVIVRMLENAPKIKAIRSQEEREEYTQSHFNQNSQIMMLFQSVVCFISILPICVPFYFFRNAQTALKFKTICKRWLKTTIFNKRFRMNTSSKIIYNGFYCLLCHCHAKWIGHLVCHFHLNGNPCSLLNRNRKRVEIQSYKLHNGFTLLFEIYSVRRNIRFYSVWDSF